MALPVSASGERPSKRLRTNIGADEIISASPDDDDAEPLHDNDTLEILNDSLEWDNGDGPSKFSFQFENPEFSEVSDSIVAPWSATVETFESVYYVPAGVRQVVQNLKEALTMERKARVIAEERLVEEIQRRARLEAKVALLEAIHPPHCSIEHSMEGVASTVMSAASNVLSRLMLQESTGSGEDRTI
ncbi:hypothetical protein K474DRAFT_593705 [Panus rudis PR-1116 ss-1]|nr:hypothetical protein K474DRAFT_593705 [Panus rudis PR-1116 ss-1]